jgi:hypothetical protein
MSSEDRSNQVLRSADIFLVRRRALFYTCTQRTGGGANSYEDDSSASIHGRTLAAGEPLCEVIQ